VFGVAQLLAVLPDLASYSRELSMQHGVFCPMTWVVSKKCMLLDDVEALPFMDLH